LLSQRLLVKEISKDPNSKDHDGKEVAAVAGIAPEEFGQNLVVVFLSSDDTVFFC